MVSAIHLRSQLSGGDYFTHLHRIRPSVPQTDNESKIMVPRDDGLFVCPLPEEDVVCHMKAE